MTEGSAELIAAESISLRYIFVLPIWGAAPSGPRRGLSLDGIHAHLSAHPEVAEAYISPLSSFYADVTVPFTTRRQLPIASLVEPREAARQVVFIHIGRVTTSWEGYASVVEPVSIPAHLAETVVFFESGHAVYAPAFILYPKHVQGGVFTSQHLTALSSLIGSSGASNQAEQQGLRAQVTFSTEDQVHGLQLTSFVEKRLAAMIGAGAKQNVYCDLVRPVLDKLPLQAAERTQARAALAALDWDDLRCATLEIVGAEKHPHIVATCSAAKEASLTVGVLERSLAALGQNIIDVSNQDDHEVRDSLSETLLSPDYALLIHPNLVTRFSSQSRSFREMQPFIGGCPYMMLTNVILAYNEYLLEQSARLIAEVSRALEWSDAKGRSNLKTAAHDLQSRVQLFENQTLNVLPNIFRYPSERQMFDAIVRQRGHLLRSETIDRFTAHLYDLREDMIELAERVATRRTNRLLLAIGVFQVSGLALAALALDELKEPTLPRTLVWTMFGVSTLIATVIAIWRPSPTR